jgi:hypothetical protein
MDCPSSGIITNQKKHRVGNWIGFSPVTEFSFLRNPTSRCLLPLHLKTKIDPTCKIILHVKQEFECLVTGRKVAGSRADEVNSFNLRNPSSRTMALGFTQPLTEMSARSRKIMFLGSKVRPVRKADNLATICEPIVYTMYDP